MKSTGSVRKIRKLIKQPGIFFRDYLNKKYPVVNSEISVSENDEHTLIRYGILLHDQDAQTLVSDNPIDVVFTWVNNQDPVWQKKFQTATQTGRLKEQGRHADDAARFANHNELYYSVHSIRKYLPWVRNIYIVTDAQTPDWFHGQYSNIRIIDHTQIIDAAYLPTFNSHVIEAHLHRIPGLGENFIYFNDDVFVARPLQPQHFFRNNNIASIFISGKSLRQMQQKGTGTPTLAASFNCIRLLKTRYNINIDAPLVHTYVPLKKSIFEKAWQLYQDEIQAFLPNKLRTNRDLNLATFLIPWLMYLEGKSVPTHEICYYFNIRSPHALTQYRKLIEKKATDRQPHSFCANDFNSLNQIPDYQEKLMAMLESYYRIYKDKQHTPLRKTKNEPQTAKIKKRPKTFL
ncbi:capsule biosynthesis protein CapC [Neisseria chenwenguii]|uniref:Capsule biosynthesis protein CapC n=1 Tax=Neisseria chenwenguii TaxID=1853278 RepID=A0A220S229_9NEIS|nr:stealth family protein [Neisseria chenwenguii]ASK27541.1 capsule biosynthesis protein CapC [Neisseria chenwenguii]